MSSTVTALPTRALGATGMDITRVGFGAWAIGGGDWSFGWGSQEDKDSLHAIHYAIERGVNWIDTAAAYGIGHSEDIVARALRDIPRAERPYVFTKCGLVSDPKDPHTKPKRIGARANLQRECDASLRRLQVERIDLYQMHWPAEDVGLDEYWQALLDLKQQGKVRAVGLSNHSVAQLDKAEAMGHVDTLQPPFSAIKRGIAGDELPWCLAHNTGVIVYSPMQSGLLTGTFSEDRAKTLEKNDWRSRSADFSGDGLKRNLRLADALRPVAERHGTSVAAVAVAWTLAFPGVTAAIVGARSAKQVDGWMDAAALTLAPNDMKDIALAIERSGAGEGPVQPRR
jgi:aryl-alcohol dehydrogenase-like predicted oxidoreductase